MIEKEISSKILHLGSNIEGRGGIAKFLRSYSKLFEEFNYIKASSNGNIFNRTMAYIKSVFLLLVVLPKRKYEIVHIHSSAPVLLHKVAIYIILSRLYNKTVVLHMHASGFEEACKSHQHWFRWLFKHVDLIICVSQDIENIIKKYKLSTDTQVLYNLIDKPTPIVVNKEGNKAHFLFMGEIIERKGIYDLLEVIGKHKTYFEGKMILSIAGGGNTKRLFQLIEQYHVTNLVDYLGWIDSEDKAKAYSWADVFILPSYSESFGLVNLEANSYGVPVLTTNVGGIPEVIHQGKNGILVEPGNTEELFGKMKFMIENPDVRREMGNNGVKVASNFYPEAIETQLKDMYCSILQFKVLRSNL